MLFVNVPHYFNAYISGSLLCYYRVACFQLDISSLAWILSINQVAGYAMCFIKVYILVLFAQVYRILLVWCVLYRAACFQLDLSSCCLCHMLVIWYCLHKMYQLKCEVYRILLVWCVLYRAACFQLDISSCWLCHMLVICSVLPTLVGNNHLSDNLTTSQMN